MLLSCIDNSTHQVLDSAVRKETLFGYLFSIINTYNHKTEDVLVKMVWKIMQQLSLMNKVIRNRKGWNNMLAFPNDGVTDMAIANEMTTVQSKEQL